MASAPLHLNPDNGNSAIAQTAHYKAQNTGRGLFAHTALIFLSA